MKSFKFAVLEVLDVLFVTTMVKVAYNVGIDNFDFEYLSFSDIGLCVIVYKILFK